MNRFANISLIAFVLWIVIYTLFGKLNATWGSIHYCVESLMIVFVLVNFKKVRFVKKWLVNLLISYFSLRVVFNVVSFLNIDLGRSINRSYETMLFISLTVILWLIINRKK